MAVDETVFGSSGADELSDSELEQYGVWVKSGPEDLEDDGDESFQLEDFSVDELEDSAKSFLGDTEDTDSLDLSEDIFDEVPVFSDEEEDLLAELERSDEGPEPDPFSVSGGKSYELDIDEDLSSDSELQYDDIEQEFDAVEPSLGGLHSADELEEPVSVGEPEEEGYPDLELNTSSLPDDEESDDFEDIQIDLDQDSSIPELELEQQSAHGVADLTPEEEELLREENLGDELVDGVATEKDEDMDQAAYRLLEKIQEEIAAIKEELHEVREGLGEIRSYRAVPATDAADGAPAPPAQTPEPSAEQGQVSEAGFFEEDEDETIALTGDELDNILNTADFVETAGEPTPVEETAAAFAEPEIEDAAHPTSLDTEEDLPSVDDIEMQEDIIPLDTDLELEDEEISLDIDLEESSLDTLSDTESDELELDTLSDTETDELELDTETDELELDTETDELELDTETDELELDTETDELELDTETDELELTDDLDLADLESELDTLAGEDVPLPNDTEIEDESELPIEEITIDQLASEDDELSTEVLNDDQSSPDMHDGLDTLAQLDIDSELADIDELKDAPDDTFADTSDIDDISISLSEEEEPDLGSFEETIAAVQEAAESDVELSDDLREEIRAVLRYMDQLLESLPEDKIQEFAASEHFDVYKKLFEELGLET